MNATVTILLFFILFTICTDDYAQSVYELDGKKEAALLIGGTAMMLVGFYQVQKIEPFTEKEINQLNIQNVPRFDRWTCTRWSPKISKMSDYLLTLSMALPSTLLFSKDIRKNASTVSVIYIENFILSTAGFSLSKGIVKRSRPYAYNPHVPMTNKKDRFTRRSFYSGHTASAFSSTILWATIFSEYYPDSHWKPYVWGGAISLATIVGCFRVLAGVHYPSDVLVGALMGSLTGYLIPKIHEQAQENDVNPVQYNGFCISFTIPF